MDLRVILVFATVLSVTGTLAVAFAVSWSRVRRRVRALEGQLKGIAPEATVAQLETTVAALSAQVEQLANEHDYLSRFVTERLQPARPHEPGSRPVTPR